MLSGSEDERGWTLREAVRRTVHPDVLGECVKARKAWREAGSPRIRPSSTRRGPAEQAALRSIAKRLKDSTFRVEAALRDQLGSGRLIAWGRRDGRVAELKPIPTSAWDQLAIKDYRRSILLERTIAKTPIFDVRIYPLVEAPNAVDHLTGTPLVHAFRFFVFEDAQAVTLRDRAKGRGGSPLELGFQRRLYQALWPVDCGKGDWNRQLKYIHPWPGPSRLADLVLGHRFSRLVGYLASGDLIANGVTHTGQTELIPRSMWVRERTHLDLTNGDLLEYSPDQEVADGFSEPIYFGLMLYKPGSPSFEFHVNTPERDSPPSNPILTGERPPAVRRVTPQRASIEAAIATIWPEGIPLALPLKVRDQKIMDWQKAQSLAIASSKTIRRYLAVKVPPHS